MLRKKLLGNEVEWWNECMEKEWQDLAFIFFGHEGLHPGTGRRLWVVNRIMTKS